MAPKKPHPKEDPPAASSSSSEEASTEEEYSTEEEQEEETQSQPTKPNPKSQSTTPSANKPELDSDSGSETDSGSASEPTKVVAKKPTHESKKRTLESLVTVAVSPPKAELKDSKRAKKMESNAVGEKSEDQKKQLFQRLFSEDDEVSLLEGLIEFTSRHGFSTSKDMNSFHEFIKKSMHFDVSVSQLKDKIDRLKKKFRNNVNKGRASTSFTSLHEQNMFNLSKRIWGDEGTTTVVESSAKSNGKSKSARENVKMVVALKRDMEMDVVKEKDAEKAVAMEIDLDQKALDLNAIGAGKVEDFVFTAGLDVLGEAKRAELQEKWRQYKVAALELFIRRSELLKEQANHLLDAYKNKND